MIWYAELIRSTFAETEEIKKEVYAIYDTLYQKVFEWDNILKDKVQVLQQTYQNRKYKPEGPSRKPIIK